MAKFLDKDPYIYEQERYAFTNQLRQFHATKGTPFFRLPTIAGKTLDLYLLYNKVIAWGGLAKVTEQGKWETLQEYFGIPATCGHAVFALRQFYIKYLESYERIHHQGEDAEEVLRSRSRPATPSSMPQKRNMDTRRGREISDLVRSNAGLCTKKPRISEYDKIMFSLQSGLPNEVDFAINVCTLLSNEGRHVLHLERAVKLIDLLLAHCGVFYEGPGGYRSLYQEDWKPTTERDFVTFWYDTVTDSDIREIIGPDTLRTQDHCKVKDGDTFSVRPMGLNDIEGQRILQVAVILRNLSFEDHNKKVMAAHRTFYRFLLLCIHNSCTALQQLGMDTLSNIAEEFILDPIDYRSTQLMFHTIDKAMKNQDKFIILRAMEVVEKLSQVDSNMVIIRQCMEERVYRSIISLLTIHDVQLLLGALEVLLALSQRGEVFCTRIATIEKSVDVLVCLVTLDAQSLGAEAFLGIKIVDHAPDGVHHPIVTMARYQAVSQTPPPSNAVANTPPHPVSRQVQPPSTPSPAPAPAPAQNHQINRDTENEKFTCQWLHSFFEADSEGSVSRLDLYSDYLSACSKASRVNIVTSTNFATCIKMVFPAAGFQRAETETGPQLFITGMRKRILPLPFNWQMYRQNIQASPNYQPQLGGPQSNLASSIMQRMAQRLSPSPSGSSSGTSQQWLLNQGMASPGSSPMLPMYRAGMMPGGSGTNTGSSSQLQQLILGHGLRQQNPGTSQIMTQAQSSNQVIVGVSAGYQVPQQQMQQQQQVVLSQMNFPKGIQQEVVNAKPVPTNCPPNMVQGVPDKASSADDSDMLSPQGSLVNQAGVPNAFLQNPLPQHSQTIANNDPSKSPGRSPSSPGRAPPPYRPRSPAGSGSKSSVPTSSVLNSETTISTTSKLPSPAVSVATEVLQEGEVKIEKIPNIHAQLPLDTNQVPTTFPQQESENFTRNSIPLLQTKTPENSNTATVQTTPVVYNAHQQALQQVHQQGVPAVANNSVTLSSGQQALNIPQQQLYIAQQQLQSAKGMHINPQGIQLSAQGIQIAPPRHQQQGNTQGIQVQMPTGQVKQWIQPQGSQPNAQGTLNTGAQGIVATNGFKGCQPNMHIVQQGVLSGTQGIQLVHQNSLPVQTTISNFHIKQPDGQGVSQIISKPAPTQQQQFIVSNCTGPTKNGNQVYSAYAVVQNIQQSVPTVLGQVTTTNPGQAAQGGVQPPAGSTATYIPIQPKLSGQKQLLQPQQTGQQQQHVVQQQHHMVQQQQHTGQQQCHFVPQQQPAQQQQQPQYILTSVQGALPQQSFAVTTIANAQQQQQQATFTVNVASSASYPAVQSAVKLCPQYTTSQSNQSSNTVAVNHAQPPNQPHIDSPLIKQLLQSGSSVQPPGTNHLPQTQVSNPNMQNTVQWVVPQNPSGGVLPSYGNSVQGLVNIQGAITQQVIPQAFAVNPSYTQLGQSTNQQTTMHFIPPLSSSPSPTASPALSCSSSSSPSSTFKSGTLSPLHKSEKKSKSKSHKSKKSSKKKKSKSGTRSPLSICSKVQHGKDVLDDQEKEESVQMVENASLDKDDADHAQEQIGICNKNLNTCNNTGSLELASQTLTNRTGVTNVNDCTLKPTCNGSATNDITQSYEIQKLKSKLDEASLKQPLLNGYGSGDELDKKHKDVLIHRAELLLENSSMEFDKALKSSQIQREIEQVGLSDRTCKLNLGAESVEKQCSNNVMNGDIPEKYKNSKESDVDALLHSRDKLGVDGESVRDFAKDDAKLSEECEEIREAAVNNEMNREEPMDQSDSKRDRDSESDSGIVLNERTGFMYDVSGAIIAPIPDSNCDQTARELDSIVPTTANNLNNNSNPQLPVISDKGNLANNLPHEVPMEGTMCSEKPKSPLQSTVQPTSGLNTQSNESVTKDCQTAGVEMNSQNADQTSPGQTGNSLPVSQEKVQVKHKPVSSETKSEKSSSSKSKKPSSSSDSKHSSGKHSRHSSESSSSKKRRRSSSSSSSSHHRKSSSSSSSDKSKHHHHHHQQLQQQQQEHQQQPEAEICICDWSGCRRSFKTRKSLHVHTSTAHVMVPTYRGLCEWENCDNIQRQRWSCVSHILDKHCTEQALRAAAERRQAASTPSSSTSASGTFPTPILYNAHTAYHAIRRSLHAPSLKDLLGESEGPVTKSIRITAALVLKNMATYSADARSLLRRHEVHLAKLAISNAEASSTLAKCVGELNDERHLDYDDLSDESSDS